MDKRPRWVYRPSSVSTQKIETDPLFNGPITVAMSLSQAYSLGYTSRTPGIEWNLEEGFCIVTVPGRSSK